MATDNIEICNLALAELGDISITALNTSSKAARLCSVFYEQIRDELLESFAWKFAKGTTYFDEDLQDYEAVSAISSAADAVTGIETLTITTGAVHGWTTGMAVRFTGLGGATELNGGEYRIASVPLTTTLTLGGVDGADVSTFTSGGNVRRAPLCGFEYAYLLPSDFLCDVKKENEFSYEIEEGALFTNETAFFFKYQRKETDTTKYSASFTALLAAKIRSRIAFPLTQSAKIQANSEVLLEKAEKLIMKQDGYKGKRDERKSSRWLDKRK